jgi:AraC-like DNA-binding protein
MSETPTILVRAVSKLIDAVEAAGIRKELFLDEVGFDAALFDDPDNRIPYSSIVAMYEHASRITGDDCFGLHIGERVNPPMFDLIGYIIMKSPTLGEAMQRAERYHSIWNAGASYNLTIEGELARLAYQYVECNPDSCRQDCEATLAIVVNFGRLVTGVDWTPRSVNFRHRAPADISEHLRIFRAPVYFGRQQNELIFDRYVLDLPVIKADPNLFFVLDRHARDMLTKLRTHGDSLGARVRRLLDEALRGGDPGLEAIAKQMSMSARTLQRRLKEEDTSYQDLIDEMRRELSLQYLRESSMAICEVAYLLGFSEPSAFHRAFRRWTGTTPNAFRAHLMQNAAQQ